MNRRVLICALAVAMPVAIFAQTNGVDRTIAGVWNSTAFGGRAIGDQISRIQYIFKTNGAFSVSAEMKDGTHPKYVGAFELAGEKLRLSIPEKGTNDLPYSFSNGMLRIRDPKLDSWVEFKKDAEQSAAPLPSAPRTGPSEGAR